MKITQHDTSGETVAVNREPDTLSKLMEPALTPAEEFELEAEIGTNKWNARVLEGYIGLYFINHMDLEPYTDLPAPLPCPFKHGDSEGIDYTSVVELCRPADIDSVYEDDTWYAQCYVCSAQGPWAGSKEEAASRWNDRCTTGG